MAEILNTCPNCKFRFPEVIKLHNPDTQDMNCKATFKCEKCNHTWDGLETSPHYKRLREKRMII